jgi:hypothetical protein
MGSGDHEELVFLLGHLRHHQGAVGIECAHQEVDTVFLQQLSRRLHGRFGIRRIIRFQDHHLAAEDTATFVIEIDGHVRPVHIVDR